MKTNHLAFEERLRIGKQDELQELDRLNAQSINFGRHTLSNWRPVEQERDINDKLDFYVDCLCGLTHTVQYKRRESGMDATMALVRPYPSDEDFRQRWTLEPLALYDRDLKSRADFYLVKNAEESLLVKGKILHDLCINALDQMTYCRVNISKFGTFNSDFGVQLKFVRDATSKQPKIMAYVPFNILKEFGAKII